MEMRPIPPETYAMVLPLIAETPATLDARARLLAGNGETVVYADDEAAPMAAAIEWTRNQEHVVTFTGEWDEPTLAAYVRALERPANLRAPSSLAARLPALRADLVAEPYVTFGPPVETDVDFRVLPPGGVRRLRPADARGLGAIPDAVGGAYDTTAAALRGGIVYARYLRAEIVSIACVAARTEHFARIAAFTIERARGNGFARECGSRLIGALAAEWNVAPLLTCAAADGPAHNLARALDLTEAHEWTTYTLP